MVALPVLSSGDGPSGDTKSDLVTWIGGDCSKEGLWQDSDELNGDASGNQGGRKARSRRRARWRCQKWLGSNVLSRAKVPLDWRCLCPDLFVQREVALDGTLLLCLP
uniref:Uncharacterized protein n=1 Tax=Oryza nivara TaxID=4536 RepID=A0A0E0H3P5_ORYNI